VRASARSAQAIKTDLFRNSPVALEDVRSSRQQLPVVNSGSVADFSVAMIEIDTKIGMNEQELTYIYW
jgi:hypothetical protein